VELAIIVLSKKRPADVESTHSSVHMVLDDTVFLLGLGHDHWGTDEALCEGS
jgi:hypothetical protein